MDSPSTDATTASPDAVVPGPEPANAGARAPRRRTTRKNGTMHVSAKVDYAMRALLEISRATEGDRTLLIKGDQLASSQQIPARFLEGILRQLRQAGIVASQRGADGGYRLARPADEISVADVVRALDGPLADVRGDRPENAEYNGAAEHLKDVWVATRAALRGVLDHVTLADIATGKLPSEVTDLTHDPAAWGPR